MARGLDMPRWRERLAGLIERHRVPGASLAVWADGRLATVTAGVLNTATGVEVTADSLFQIGSITKTYTATVLMRLVERGLATPDTAVASVLPEFQVADGPTTERVTIRHLLNHTSGITGDFFHDTGRGDDCLQRYVTACATLPQSHPLGATVSYCNTGYIIAGRIIERLTGTTWDAALTEHVTGPLGLEHTWTLPEDVLRFRAAMGHLAGPSGAAPQPAPAWTLMRSMGPAGLVCATAADVIAFARMHLDGGRAADGTAVLQPATIAQMRRPQSRLPHPYGMCGGFGLGWALFDRDGRAVFGHDGDTIGQSASLRAVPDAGVAIALLANSDATAAFHHEVQSALLAELCGVRVPEPPRPPDEPPRVDPGRYAGVYERVRERIEVTVRDGRVVLSVTPTGELAHLAEPYEIPLVPHSGDLLLGRPPGFTRWAAYFFYRLADGSAYLHDGARATPKVG